MRRLLVPLDGSELAARALPLARQLAARPGGQVVLARAVPYASAADKADAAMQRGLLSWIKSDLDRLASNQSGVGDCWARVCRGDPADALVELADLIDADTIVMSSHGRAGLSRWLFGSVAEAVLRRAGRPVLIVPPADPPAGTAEPTVRRVLVPLDGSPAGEAVLDAAAGLARALDAGLVLLRVVEPGDTAAAGEAGGYLCSLAQRLRGRAARTEIRVEMGEPAPCIELVARELAPLALAMATHGRDGLGRVLLGSVAAAAMHRTRLPTLLVRPATGDWHAEAVPLVATMPAEDRIGPLVAVDGAEAVGV